MYQPVAGFPTRGTKFKKISFTEIFEMEWWRADKSWACININDHFDYKQILKKTQEKRKLAHI